MCKMGFFLLLRVPVTIAFAIVPKHSELITTKKHAKNSVLHINHKKINHIQYIVLDT